MIKNYLLLISSVFVFHTLSAQSFVSTSPESKNAVLEEYTGIYCGYCPDGHKRANDLAANNPGDVVLINIHVGGFSTPRSGDPDFRTQWGTAIDNLADVRGYPAGSVNRRRFAGINHQGGSSAMSRGDWSSAATTVMSEASPVNVAIQSEVDIDNKELNITVEVYYTGESTASENRLNVAVLQNNVVGPQTTYGNYNPDGYLLTGDYLHQHMLRDFVTGQWGEKLDSTTLGAFFSKTYTWSIPDDINDVDVMLQNLEVAAYVTEGSSDGYEVLSGVAEKAELPADKTTDLALGSNTNAPSDICATQITPSLTITNEGSEDVTSFDITATINGTPNTQSFSGTLGSGQSTTLDWNNVNLPGGEYSLAFGFPENINGGDLYDINIKNDVLNSIEGFSFLDNAISSGDMAGFENMIDPGFALEDNSPSGANSVRMYYSTQARPGYRSNGAVLFYLHESWGVNGRPGHITFGKTDLTAISNPAVSFLYGYSDGNYGGTAPMLEVSVSTDCGDTWTQVQEWEAVETGEPAQAGQIYIPTDNEYRYLTASLEDFADESDVIVRVSGIPGTHGSGLWIDDVEIGGFASIDDNILDGKVSIYPNPTKENLTVELSETSGITGYSITNALGQEIINVNNFNLDNNVLNINVSEYTPGVYQISFRTDKGMATRKFVVSE